MNLGDEKEKWNQDSIMIHQWLPGDACKTVDFGLIKHLITGLFFHLIRSEFLADSLFDQELGGQCNSYLASLWHCPNFLRNHRSLGLFHIVFLFLFFNRPKRRMDSCVILLILAALRCFPFLFLIHRLPESKRSPEMNSRLMLKKCPLESESYRLLHNESWVPGSWTISNYAKHVQEPKMGTNVDGVLMSRLIH